ncbi:hypothetical protein QC763_101093 [Podospora pseudopauciseta]|uniref:ASCH domain-containing protein n=1 Tax=Podospora pseudopauciseta TaxID=2093780 RepID=A0ABR0HWD7_9PEZI|nr:hypothetical protein QC763_101093 [Podospora pseudopauciseta]
MREPYMTQILEETKRYEFRKYRMADTVNRAWFYRVTPISAIAHVGDIAPPVTRRGDSVTVRKHKSENERLVLDIPAWKWGQYADENLTVYELETPITLHKLKEKYGFAGPPGGMVYLPDMIKQDVDWENQKKVDSLWAQVTWN